MTALVLDNTWLYRKLVNREEKLETLALHLHSQKEELAQADKSEPTPVEIVSYKPTQVRLRTELSQPGVLCLTDFYYRGWRATDNGADIAIHPGNLVFRAIPLTAGKHDIVMEFSPPGMKLGGIVSILAWMLWAFGCWKTTRRVA